MGNDKPSSGMTRREWLRAAALVGAGVAAGGALLTLKLGQVSRGRDPDAFLFVRGEAGPGEDMWWNALAGREAHVPDFSLWGGAMAVWKPSYDEDGDWLPGTGMSALLIRLPASRFTYPAAFEGKFVRIAATPDVEESVIVALFDRCTHLCGNPGWHVRPIPQDFKRYLVPPTTEIYDQDPIWCQSHNAMYDPLSLMMDRHPNGTEYIGARLVHGPGTTALPAIPLRREGEILLGREENPGWYSAYCR